MSPEPLQRRLRDDEQGVSLPLVALMMFVLMGMAAFAVDLGWFYVNASHIQRAADAGALSGVVHMPQRFDLATTAADAMTTANGYTDSSPGYPKVVVSKVTGNDNALQVTVSDRVPTFFLKVFGMRSQVITRSAEAEYVPPLPLGSPSNQFGNDPTTGNYTYFWANIHGKYTDSKMGDAFSSYCASGTGSGSGGCAQNPDWRSRGYLYGIEANGETSFTVNILDGAFHNRTGGNPNGDYIRTGDHNNFCSNNSTCLGPSTTFTLYAPSPTPFDLASHTQLCSYTYAPEPQVPASDPYSWSVPASCFTQNSPTAGIYVLQVKLENPTDPSKGSGLNRYSLKVTSPTSSARLYGLGDISIYNNFTGSNTQFYLAQVSDAYKGKTFVVELYDPGDAQNGVSNIIHIQGPGGTDWSSCLFQVRSQGGSYGGASTLSPCAINATRPTYNYDGKWLKIQIQLPATYSCTSDCWWKIRYQYNGTANDTTTWRAYIVGNPVHLIPNG